MTPLPTSRPSEQGVDARGVLALVEALDVAERIEPHSLILLRHGRVVAEAWWAPYTPDRLQLVYSLSKNFTATAVGLAQAEGLLSVDAPVLTYFPELAGTVTDPRTQRMLVRHLLTMTSGHTSESFEAAQSIDPDDVARGFLQLAPDTEPGTVFAYTQPCTYTLAAIVGRVTGQGLVDYLRPRLLDPIGIGEVAWTRHRSGQELGFSGLHATTEAVARLGQLHLARGVWDDRRLLPESWVDEASRPHVDNAAASQNADSRRGYGFQLWTSRYGYRGDGAYGQFCLVLPEHDAVLAMTSATVGTQAVLDLVWQHLVPALGRAGDAAADDELAAATAGLCLPLVAGDVAGSPDWHGFSATTSGVVGGLALYRRDDGWWATLSDGAAVADPLHLDVRLGLGSWEVHEGPVPLATSAAWSGDELVIDLVFLETPHRLRLTCRLDEPQAGSEWMTEPSSRSRLSDLAAPRAGEPQK